MWQMKTIRSIAAVALVTLGLVFVSPAAAQEMDMCPHDATVAALHTCVTHAVEHGHIDNAGIARSLHAKLNAADAALAAGDVDAALDALGDFVNELAAQSGKHVDAMAATHLRMHAETVIAALQA
jgi:hypothetical protein